MVWCLIYFFYKFEIRFGFWFLSIYNSVFSLTELLYNIQATQPNYYLIIYRPNYFRPNRPPDVHQPKHLTQFDCSHVGLAKLYWPCFCPFCKKIKQVNRMTFSTLMLFPVYLYFYENYKESQKMLAFDLFIINKKGFESFKRSCLASFDVFVILLSDLFVIFFSIFLTSKVVMWLEIHVFESCEITSYRNRG